MNYCFTCTKQIISKYYRYKIHNVQLISEDDPDLQITVLRVMQVLCNQTTPFISQIIFSGKSTCCKQDSESINLQILVYRICWTIEAHTEYPLKVKLKSGRHSRG